MGFRPWAEHPGHQKIIRVPPRDSGNLPILEINTTCIQFDFYIKVSRPFQVTIITARYFHFQRCYSFFLELLPCSKFGYRMLSQVFYCFCYHFFGQVKAAGILVYQILLKNKYDCFRCISYFS